MKLATATIALFSVSMFACSEKTPDPTLEMATGWVRALPPGSAATSAYGNLKNNANEAIHIVSFKSDGFSNTSLHETRIDQGVSRMEHHSNWTIGPGEQLELQPGGMHIMLMQPTRDVETGSEVKFTLTDETGKTYSFSLPVEAR